MTTSAEPRPLTIVRLLGSGGMAQVFEAVTEGAGGFRRRVALKRILPDHEADEGVRRSFFDEARIVSHLHHGGIVGVLDYGIADGVPFQILELVLGADARTLAESGRKKGVPLSPGMALHVCREVAHALHYAHEARGEDGHPLGLVHRDVKPANILLSWSGDVKLGDFGIAFATARTEQTLDGAAKGTPPYMSPEQSRGDDVDARADVFSLGCALHALLCGKSPLAAHAALLCVLRGEDAPLDPDLDDDVRAIVRRATHTDRERRYRTAGEMAEALGRAAARRLEHDPKSELIAWIAAVRPEPARPRPTGRLDALLGAELLLAEGTHEGTFRRTAPQQAPLITDPTRKEGPPAATPILDTPSPPAADTASLPAADTASPLEDNTASPLKGNTASPLAGSEEQGGGAPSSYGRSAEAELRLAERSPQRSGRSPRRYSYGALGAGLGAAAVIGLVVVSWVRFGPATPGVSAAATAPETVVEGPAGSAADTMSAGVAPGPADAPSVTNGPTTGTVAPRSTGPHTLPLSGSAHPISPGGATPSITSTAIPSGTPLVPSTPAAPSQAPSAAQAAGAAATDLALTGTLAVGGPVGATIRIDGAPRGLTPKYIPLSLGAHRVEVVSSDGARLGATVVTLKPEHTPSAPLRWSPPKAP